MVELNRKAISDVLEKNAVALNQVLEVLNVEMHSLSYIAILFAKLNHACVTVNLEKVGLINCLIITI